MSALDITLRTMYRINQQDWQMMPGLLAQNPPKRTARGREQDRLIVYLTLAGNIAYTASQYTQFTAQLSEVYYNTPGSLTNALKAAIEDLNARLVDGNMRSTSKGQYTIGALILSVLRQDQLFVAQSGPTHVYLLGAETRHLHDAAMSGKGLGLSQTVKTYIAQAQIRPGEKNLYCAALPQNWEKALADDRGHGTLESARRRLMAITESNVSAVLWQATPGTGNIQLLGEPAPKPPAPPEQKVQPVQAASAPPPPREQIPEPAEEEPAPLPPAPLEQIPEPGEEEAVSAPPPPLEQTPEPVEEEPAAAPPPPRQRQKSSSPQIPSLSTEDKEKWQNTTRSAARLLAVSLHRSRLAWQTLTTALGHFIPRLLPEEETGEPSAFLSRSWRAFFAALVPLLMLTIGVTVYNYWGQPEQYLAYYNQAVEARNQAINEADPLRTRTKWQTVLNRLEEARQHKDTPEALSLQQEAQNALDGLDKVTRVDFKPAFAAPLSSSVNITRMAASDTDIYLLDASRGAVMRGVFNGRAYDLDSSFACQPGTYDGIQVGALLDIFALPRSNPSGATLVGIDLSGNLLYCAPGEAPRAGFLQRPEAGWSAITAIAYDANNLYLLDATSRAVWVYFGDFTVNFANKPFFFFESQVPAQMESAIDIAVNGDDLYLLYTDGHLTTCTLSRILASPTRCNDPAQLTDTRPGYPSGSKITDGAFSQITFTTPPDPSVALLEPFTQSIYRFSAQALELQKQIHALPGEKNPLPANAPLSAMAFSPNKSLFVFADGQLYFAINVP